MRPRSSTRMRSARSTVVSRCAMTIVVRPSIRRASASWTRYSLSLSSDDVASSRRSTGESRSSARAIAIRCRCPTESLTPRSPTIVSYFSGSRSMNSVAFAASAAATSCASVARGERHGPRLVLDVGHRVEQGEDAVGRAERFLDLGPLGGEPADGPGDHAGIEEERDELAGRCFAADHLVAAVPEHDDRRGEAEEPDEREERGRKARALEHQAAGDEQLRAEAFGFVRLPG